jgi:uncharacterized protein YukE
MAAVQVLVGANAATDAQAFLTQVTNFTNAVTQLQTAGNKLSNQAEWQGASATKFDADYTQFVRQVKLMETSLTSMANGAKTVIDSIDQADTSGAGRIGAFQG